MAQTPSPIAAHASASAQIATHTPPGWSLPRLGFRPFCLGAALFAVLAIPLESGAKQWQVEIVKPLATKPVHGVDSCGGS